MFFRFLQRYFPDGFPANVWFGTSIEDWRVVGRVNILRRVQGKGIRFLSCEPIIGPLTGLKLGGIQWVIAGGESGPNHRDLNLDWVRQLRDSCIAWRIPFFFKQVGGVRPKSGGRLLDGREWNEMPDGKGP